MSAQARLIVCMLIAVVVIALGYQRSVNQSSLSDLASPNAIDRGTEDLAQADADLDLTSAFQSAPEPSSIGVTEAGPKAPRGEALDIDDETLKPELSGPDLTQDALAMTETDTTAAGGITANDNESTGEELRDPQLLAVDPQGAGGSAFDAVAARVAEQSATESAEDVYRDELLLPESPLVFPANETPAETEIRDPEAGAKVDPPAPRIAIVDQELTSDASEVVVEAEEEAPAPIPDPGSTADAMRTRIVRDGILFAPGGPLNSGGATLGDIRFANGALRFPMKEMPADWIANGAIPDYPTECTNEAGDIETVTVRFRINRRGRAFRPRSAYASDDCFARAAIRAARQSKFKVRAAQGFELGGSMFLVTYEFAKPAAS